MKSLLTGGLIAALVSTTSLAPTPARAAEGGEILGLLAGIAALAIIGKEISDRRDERHAQQLGTTNSYRPHAQGIYNYNHQPRKKIRRRALPSQCLRTVQTDRGVRDVLVRRCLRRNDINVNRLPDRCERRFRTDRGSRVGYGARCIQRQGFRIVNWQ